MFRSIIAIHFSATCNLDRNLILLLALTNKLNTIFIFYFYLILTKKRDDVEGWILYYQDIVQLFRNLIRKMTEDADLYRHQIKNLEHANAQLSAKMGNFEEKKLALLKLAELNEVDKANLSKAFWELKTRINVKANDNEVLRDQIARLEHELKKVLSYECN
jgi:septal ring factor EnvC (AmiA/AmiB activator)